MQLPVLAVTVYVVLVAGDNTGLAIAGLLTPAVGDQLYEVALLTVRAINDAPLQMDVSEFTVSVIFDCTVTVNVLETVQAPVVPVTVYVVVAAGVSVGFTIAGLLTPAVGNQL